MPRMGRLNLPGGLFHVIGRGLERRRIFSRSSDKQSFLERLEEGLANTDHRCYAWALMDNHYHLLLRQGQESLAALMAPLLGGYAQSYNKRHQRVGYLFQGRYRSILCEEQAYFLELVRYIHLNPVKAGVILNISALNRYQWTSHAIYMGNNCTQWVEINAVLSQFGELRRIAQSRYCRFIKEGINVPTALDDYEGGGIVRSIGGRQELVKLARDDHRRLGDERILGGEDFVLEALKHQDENTGKNISFEVQPTDFEEFIQQVCSYFSIPRQDFHRRGRKNSLSNARAVVAYWGVTKFGITTVELSCLIGISHQGVSKAVRRGAVYINENKLRFEDLVNLGKNSC